MRISARRAVGLALLVLVGYAAWSYASAPLFWQRYLNGFLSAGKGADSAVFDYRATVRASDSSQALPKAEIPRLSNAARESLIEYAKYHESFALLVVYEGKLEMAWYAEGYSSSSLTQSQSMHKSLQAVLVGIAVDEGLIDSIDDPIAKYLPDTPSFRGSVRDFLQMGSGLKPFEGGFSPSGEAFRWLYASDIYVRTLAIPQPVQPGTEFTYHDGATQVLGMMLTHVFGQPYTEYLWQHIWNPMGGFEAQVWLDNENGTPHYNCCLLARAEEWAKLGLIVKNDGEYLGRRIVSSAWLQQQTTPKLTPHYGFQTWLASNETPNPREGGGGYRRSENWLASDVVYFSGYGAQRVYISQEADLVIVRLGPAAGYFPKINEEWDNTFLFNTVVRDLQRSN